MSEFYTVITQAGLDEIYNSILEKRSFDAKYMVFGDSAGSYYEPNQTQTELKNQKYKTELFKQGKNSIKNYIYFQGQIPPSEGDYYIREVGLLDSKNNLLAVAKYPETLKLKADSESNKSLNIELQILLSNKGINTILIDDSGVLVTKEELEMELNNKADTNLANLTSEGEKHFLNKTQITNCILSKPSNPTSFESDTVKVHSGLRVLIPDGLYEDGTLKNIDLILDKDVNWREIYTGSTDRFVSISHEGNLRIYDRFYCGEDEPQQHNTLWYKPSQNKTYAVYADLTKEVKETFIGKYSRSDMTITAFSLFNTVNLLKRSDIEELTSLSMPSEKYIDLTPPPLSSTPTQISYRAPADGWAYVLIGGGKYNGAGITNETKNFTVNTHISSGAQAGVIIPVQKNDLFKFSIQSGGDSPEVRACRFIYAQGEI